MYRIECEEAFALLLDDGQALPLSLASDHDVIFEHYTAIVRHCIKRGRVTHQDFEAIDGVYVIPAVRGPNKGGYVAKACLPPVAFVECLKTIKGDTSHLIDRLQNESRCKRLAYFQAYIDYHRLGQHQKNAEYYSGRKWAAS
mgnify:FL=1|jgi:hypothetical protein